MTTSVAQNDEGLLKIDATAKVLNVSTKTVYGLIQTGQLPAMRIGRLMMVSTSRLRRYIDERHKEFAKEI